MSAMLKMVLNQFGLQESDVKAGLEKFNAFMASQETQAKAIDKILQTQLAFGEILVQALTRESSGDCMPLLETLEFQVLELKKLIKPEALSETVTEERTQ